MAKACHNYSASFRKLLGGKPPGSLTSHTSNTKSGLSGKRTAIWDPAHPPAPDKRKKEK